MPPRNNPEKFPLPYADCNAEFILESGWPRIQWSRDDGTQEFITTTSEWVSLAQFILEHLGSGEEKDRLEKGKAGPDGPIDPSGCPECGGNWHCESCGTELVGRIAPPFPDPRAHVERNAKISDLHAALAEVTSQRERARTSLERREQDCLEFANQVRALKEQIANQGQTIRDELLPLGSTREALDDLERENGVLRQFIRDFL